MTLADRIVVLDQGVVAQVGAPLELYAKPENKFVASFIGSPTMNFLPVTTRRVDGIEFTLALDRPGGSDKDELSVAARRRPDPDRPAPSEIGIRPEHIAITDASDSRADLFGTVQLVERLGNLTIAYIETGAGLLVIQGGGELAIHTDDLVGLVFDRLRTHMFGADGRVI